MATNYTNGVSLLVLPLLFTLGACVSSEESGGAARATAPQPTTPLIDSTISAMTLEPPAKVSTTTPAQRKSPRVTTKRDTVQASVVRKDRTSSRSVRPIQRPENPTYTVQVGAFRNAGNALRFQGTAKQRKPGFPVPNTYDPSDKLYRVSIGLFKMKREADSLRRELRQQFPKDYHDAWVIYTNR